MKHIVSLFHICCLAAITMLVGCEKENVSDEGNDRMRFNITHPSQTRATASDFEASDKVGLFVTEATEPLQLSGNYVNNASLTYNGADWETATPIYYNNGTYNVYAYYPYTATLTSVDDYPFEVAINQDAPSTENAMGGYEASDFLWASKNGVAASSSPVNLTFKHRMSRVLVQLIKGNDYEGELPTDAVVYIHNTVTSSTIDLSVGMPTVNSYGTARTIQARNEGNFRYAAIVVPQRLVNRRPLVEVVMKGVSYMMESTFVFRSGVQHTISLTISKNPEQVKIEIGGEIEDWN